MLSVLNGIYIKKCYKKKKKDISDNMMTIDENIKTTDDLDHNQEIFKKLNIKRYCCKRHLLGHVDILHKL